MLIGCFNFHLYVKPEGGNLILVCERRDLLEVKRSAVRTLRGVPSGAMPR